MTTAREQRRARNLDPQFERYRNPRSRRVLAIALVALLFLQAGFLVLMDVALWPALAGLAVVASAFVVCLGALKASTRGVEGLSQEVLDERQWQLRGQVYATAYRIGATLLIAELTLVALWLGLDLPAPGEGATAAVLVLPFNTAIVLPTLVAAARADI